MIYLFASALLIASITPSWASAQSGGDSWTEPLNLSHSGIAKNPGFVVDSAGVGHVVWQDDIANFVYTRFDGNQWSPPETTSLNRLFRLNNPQDTLGPQMTIYTGPNPVFIAGPGEFTFAFWISSRGKLFTSKVRNQEFEHVVAWDSERFIAPQTAALAVAIDVHGVLHLAYVRTVSDPGYPAGIYYTRSKDSGWTWSRPALLYESSYLRRLGESQANIGLAITGPENAQHIYVVWDNLPRKQVFLAQSANGGDSWDKSTLIASPESDSASASQFNIHIGTNQNNVVLVWQSGQPGGSCNQIYQSSSDSGATWSKPQLMIEGLLGCTQSSEFVKGLTNSSEGPLYFLTETQSQIYLSAWNGQQWSQPQIEPTLSGFEEPEIYTGVDYGCHRTFLLGEWLYIVGCDQGGGGDVWVTSLNLESTTSWFSEPVWSQPSSIADDNIKMEAMELVATDDDLIHVFLSQHNDPAIYYTYWDGESWSRMTTVLELPEGEAAWPVVAAGPGNELFLIARNNSGALYLSRATSGNAATESSWSTPTRLAIGHDGSIGSVDVAWDATGTIYLVYSVPVNEERGIYLVQSQDLGTTWSGPLQIFNGAVAGFDLVGAPSLQISPNGILHVTWKEQLIEGDGDSQPVALYYARSQDSGRTFSDAELIIEEPVAWREIVADSKNNLHLLWQPQNTLTTVWDQVSLDGGNSWQFPQGLPDEGSLVTVTRDPVGRLHLVGVGSGFLEHWLWDGSRWQSETPLSLPLSSHQESLVNLLAATVNKQGKMVVVFAEPADEGDETEMTLFYATRTLELPVKQTATQKAPPQTPLSPTLTPITPTPERLSTATNTVNSEVDNSNSQTDRSESNGGVSPLTIALVPVAFLLLSVLGIVIRRVLNNR